MSAGIVLAGGRSSRMGSPKALLPWHGSTLVRRVSGLLLRCCAPVVVVRDRALALPPLPAEVELAEDAEPGQGPLEGLAAGLRAVAGRAHDAYVCAVDGPFLHPSFVRAVCGGLGDADVAIPEVAGRRQPLAAAYRTSVLPLVEELRAAGERRIGLVAERSRAVALDETCLLRDPDVGRHDPRLASVRGLDTPERYRAALAEPQPAVSAGGRVVRAATLGGALAALGAAVGARGRVNDADAADPETPLAEGDRLEVVPA